MSRAGVLTLAGLMVLAPRIAIGQPASTADGVTAFVRGDYATAVEILQPAAERWQMPFDNTAAFFMALMYDNGLGVAPDPVRACALILRTSAFSDSGVDALTFAAQTLADDFNSRLAPEQMGQCMFMVDNGFAAAIEPVTFTLAPGHWISVEDARPARAAIRARIDYAGQQTEVDLQVPVMPGVQYLHIGVTELTSLRPRPAPRYFLEAFAWMDGQGTRSTLMWFVVEIVRDTLHQVTVEELETVEGDRPDYELSALRQFARVRVNADGDAEWAVLSGAERRQDVIETDAERQEVAAERLSREAAEKKVDWTLRKAIDRAPTFAYAEASNEGCMGPAAYSWSADRTEALVLRLDPDALRSSGMRSTFAIGQANAVEIAAHVYGAPLRQWPFCSDVRSPGDEGEVWRAVAGTIVIELSAVFRVREPGTYRAAIRLDGAEFISATGARVRQSKPITLSTLVRAPQ